VLHKVQDAFNAIIADISAMQQILKWSQQTPEPETETQYASAQGPAMSRRTGFIPSIDDGYAGMMQRAGPQHR
jgi:hypothetical protein